MFLLLIVIIMFIYWWAEKTIRNRLTIKPNGIIYAHVNKVHRWGEMVIVILSLVILFTKGLKLHYVFIFNFAILAFRALMEWKHDRKSRRYILSLLNSSLGLIMFCSITIFFMPKNISITRSAFMHLSDGSISEPTKVEIIGQLKPHIIYGDIFVGQMNLDNKEFLITTFGKSRKELLSNYIRGKRSFTMIEMGGNSRGEVYASRDFKKLSGKLEEINIYTSDKKSIRFNAPIETLEMIKY